jgi:hypothetical protein
MNRPVLMFRRTFLSTGVTFDDHFTDKNCPNWSFTPFHNLVQLAQKRIASWNGNPRINKQWKYELLEWRLK